MSDNNLNNDVAKIPDFDLSQSVFLLKNPALSSRHPKALEYLLSEIEKERLGPYYCYLHNDCFTKDNSVFPWNEELYNSIKLDNEKEIATIKDKIKEAENDDEGELEIVKGYTELGEYYAKIGDRENAIITLRKAFELTPSTGSKIDILLTISRIGFFFDDLIFIKKILEETSSLIDKGGDWERRNRFKTYKGIYLMSIRNFSEASSLLIDSLTTFTSSEISSYEQIAQFASISGVVSLDRKTLKSKIVESSEILSLKSSSPGLLPIINLTNSLYNCEYSKFFKYLSEVNDEVLVPSKYLSRHASYYLREMRRKAYSQLLESYKSLSLKSMADQFGVSIEFLDNDLCKFIQNNKVNCVIDRVNGIVETNRPDNKNAQYQLLIKQGDALLTKLQKYGAAVRLSGTERVA
ncbi:proteasome regulatory particle lid subunit RPN7 [Ascoidea rubescens DSM 1968]|uniref:PCI-domain-containing protein n=1 Tax=Ascoidea rubescens DSM 1968 TaxID=1344418 RepID=A0A1D2VIW1_9ASCO|nr:PCI-domain-containing protein [Ascoidea rubescens DSM 1968]ODV61561.1 PCI-domain-containing protein [Ascoidea rubescens DSM 1968]